MLTRGGDIVTEQKFGSHRLHIEFRIPPSPRWFPEQWRGNSGVYLQGRYEIQVLDSYGLRRSLGDRDCGAIYQCAAPGVNACRPAGEWQAYDVLFRAPEFDEQRRMIQGARITVWQNGVLIHENVELRARTAGGLDEEYDRPGPLLLQDHFCPVRFRNVWVVPSSEKSWDNFLAQP